MTYTTLSFQALVFGSPHARRHVTWRADLIAGIQEPDASAPEDARSHIVCSGGEQFYSPEPTRSLAARWSIALAS